MYPRKRRTEIIFHSTQIHIFRKYICEEKHQKIRLQIHRRFEQSSSLFVLYHSFTHPRQIRLPIQIILDDMSLKSSALPFCLKTWMTNQTKKTTFHSSSIAYI
ncbi:hypothetical protein V8G54_005017 [Vigna mungo]|uniref:Uncharacterized protein n=1 Tax=Vigna mungo TaxID=3915 RepID=A0AAQ3PDJ8_VIGMU